MVPRILLVDHHPAVRCGLRVVLRSEHLDVVGEAADLRGGRQLIADLRPSVVVTEAILPDGDGIAFGAEIERSGTGAHALVLTAHTQPFFFMRARTSGISGYALKTQPPEAILEAVNAVGRGGTYAPPDFARHATAQEVAAKRISSSPFDELTERESQILELILAGRTNAAIADALCISVKTVETHRAHINRKLSVHSTGELIRISAMHGLLVAA